MKLAETPSSDQWQRTCVCVYMIGHRCWGSDVCTILVISGAEILLLIKQFSGWITLFYQACCPIPRYVPWMPHLSLISTRTIKMKTFPWGILVDSVSDAFLRVCEDGDGLYSCKSKLKLNIFFPSFTNLFIINTTLLSILLSSFPFSLFQVSFPWGINSTPPQIIFNFFLKFSPAPMLKLMPRPSKSRLWAASLWSYFSEHLQGYESRGTTWRFVSPVLWTIP